MKKKTWKQRIATRQVLRDLPSKGFRNFHETMAENGDVVIETYIPTNTYQVSWDNGNHACGTFPQKFPSQKEAKQFGRDWVREMCALEGISPRSKNNTYTFEIHRSGQ